MVIKTFVNSIFNSNSYLIYKENSTDVCVIDPGSSTSELVEWIDHNEKNACAILITHAHFDHIMGINQLTDKYPQIKIFASPYAIDGFTSEKLNGSYYQEIPFVISRKDYFRVNDGDTIKIWEDAVINVYETPGHGKDCISFYINGNLFTGDALIPGVKVYTKLKNSNKADAIHSINRLINDFDAQTMIWPGHEKNCSLNTLLALDFPNYYIKSSEPSTL